jgi:hypothetical protein
VIVGLLSLLVLQEHLEHIGSWLRWYNRPLPAMRLTASGIDYSPAFTGEFPMHVSGAIAQYSA